MGPRDLTKQYSESFDTLSDAQKQQIRKNLLGLNNKGDEVQFTRNKDAYLVRALKDGAFGIKGAQQTAFRGLAADLLQTTVDKLKKAKEREAQFDLFKGLPGFSEIAGMGDSLGNSIMAELGGAAGMAGVDAGSLFGGKGDLGDKITNMAGLGFLQGAQYNWQQWFDGELSKRYENMKEIKGIEEASQTYKLEKEFMDSFVKDYIKPRFDYSRSIDEFVDYIDVKQDEENILQTETTLKNYEKLIDKKTQKFLQDLKGKNIGFNSAFYANPLSSYERLADGNYKGLSAAKQAEYDAQQRQFAADWEEAKKDPKQKRKELGGKSWNQLAAQFGYNINDREQFARLHYNGLGYKRNYDGARDLISNTDIDNFIAEEIMPSVAELDLKFGNKPFMDFVSPEKYVDDLLGDYNVGTDEYFKELKELGIDVKDLNPDEVRDTFVSGLRTGGAEKIRQMIKYYNEKKKKPTQKLLGVSYIEREEDYDKDAINKDANPLYKLFAQSGYSGTEDEFFEEFMPDADRGDMNIIGAALSGKDGINEVFKNLDMSDPFSAFGSISNLMGENEGLFGDNARKDSSDKDSSYFDVFGDKEKEYDDYTNKYSGIKDLGTFGSFNYFK